MEFWLDTIDRTAIEQAKKLGLLHGVTTNPAILSEASASAEDVLKSLLNTFSGPLAVQVTLSSASEMVDQGKDLYDLSSRIIVKIPVIEQGIEAIHRLASIGIPVMATTIFEQMQGLLAFEAGASYLAPYFSYLGENALPICLSIQRMIGHKAKLLIAALQTPNQVVQCAECQFSAVTLKAPLFKQCLQPPAQTLEHLTRFNSAWQNAPDSNLLLMKSAT